MHVGKAFLVLDVYGVLVRDPKKHSYAKLINRLSAEELLQMGKRTSVDRFLPKLLLQSHVECVVVNGLYPQRVCAVLEGRETVCTIIPSE